MGYSPDKPCLAKPQRLGKFPTCTSHGHRPCQEGTDTYNMASLLLCFSEPSKTSFSSHGPQINVPEESETSLVGGTGRTPRGLPRTERLQGQETFQGRPGTCHHSTMIGDPLPTLSDPCRHAKSSAWVTQAAPQPFHLLEAGMRVGNPSCPTANF